MCCVQTIDVVWTWLQIESTAIFLLQQKELWVPLCSLAVFCSFQNNSCVLHSEVHSNFAFPQFASIVCHILKLIWPCYWLVVCVYAYICSWNVHFFPEGRGSSTLLADGCYCPKQSRTTARLLVIIFSLWITAVTEGRLLGTLNSVWRQWNIPWSIFFMEQLVALCYSFLCSLVQNVCIQLHHSVCHVVQLRAVSGL